MASGEGQPDGACTTCVCALDSDSAEWVRAVLGSKSDKQDGQIRLNALLVRIARAGAHRRGNRLHIVGPELDDLAYQAAADAMMKMIPKLGEFRGESRFTKWA